MFPFTKKKAPEAPAKPDAVHEAVRQRLSETSSKLEDAVRKMQERLAQRALAPVPSKVK